MAVAQGFSSNCLAWSFFGRIRALTSLSKLSNQKPNNQLKTAMDPLSLYLDMTLDYATIDEIKKKTGLLIISQNIRSLSRNWDGLESLTDGAKPAAVALQEIWQLPTCANKKIEGYKILLRQRSRKRGGGVGIIICKDLYQEEVSSPFVEGQMESVYQVQTISSNNNYWMCLYSTSRKHSGSSGSTSAVSLNFWQI
jgi:hypothetical protein